MLDLIVFFLLALGISYGIMIKRRRVMVVMLAGFIGFAWVDLVLRNLISPTKLRLFGNSDLVYVLIFLLILALLAIWGAFDGISYTGRNFFRFIFDGLFGLSAVILIVVLALALISLDLRDKFFQDSELLIKLWNQRQIWLSLPLFLLLITGLKNRRD